MKNFLLQKYLSSLTSHLSFQKGFTLTEIVIVMGIVAILVGLATLNFGNIQRKGSLSGAVETLIADLGQQQIKAMVGDTEGRGINDNYGIKFASTNYTLFHGNYLATDSANFSINFPDIVQASNTFPDSQVIFLKGSGEIDNYASASSTITLQETVGLNQTTLRLNRYGVIISAN